MAAVITAAIVASLAGASISLWIAEDDGHSLLTPGFNAAVIVAFTIVGAVVAAARPANRVGWAMLAGGLLWSLGGAAVDLAVHGIVTDPGSVPGEAAFAVTGSALRGLGWMTVTLVVPALFPDGRLREARWQWLRVALVLIAVGSVLDPLSDPQAGLRGLGDWQNPLALEGLWRVIDALRVPHPCTAQPRRDGRRGHTARASVAPRHPVAAPAARDVRRRGSTADRRRADRSGRRCRRLDIRRRGLAPAVCNRVRSPRARPLRRAHGGEPHARLDHDLRGRRGGLRALHRWRDGDAPPLGHVAWLPWAAAAIVALLFAPLRDSLQRAVNRLTFGRWDEPYDVLADLGQRLEATVDVDRLLDDVISELGGLGLDDVAICDEDGHVIAGGLSVARAGCRRRDAPACRVRRTGRDPPIPPTLYAVACSRPPPAR